MTILAISDKVHIYYEVRGDGFPLVLIHGLRANSNWWSPYFLHYLVGKFEVIQIDLRGTGRSSAGRPRLEEQKNFSFNDLADDVIAVLDHLNLEKCHVLGISMGGRVVQSLLTKKKGNRIEKAILVSSLCMTKSYPIRSSFRQMTSKEFIRFFLPRFFTSQFSKDNPQLIKAFCERAEKFETPFTTYELQLEAIKEFQGCDVLQQVNHEVLIIHGQQDSFIPVKHAYQLQSVLKNSILHIFPNEGHLLFDTDKLEEKATLVINFLLSNEKKKTNNFSS